MFTADRLGIGMETMHLLGIVQDLFENCLGTPGEMQLGRVAGEHEVIGGKHRCGWRLLGLFLRSVRIHCLCGNRFVGHTALDQRQDKRARKSHAITLSRSHALL